MAHGWRTGSLSIHDARDVALDHVYLSGRGADDLLHLAHAEVQLRACRFSDGSDDGLDADAARFTAVDCTFERLGGDAVDLMMSEGLVVGAQVRDAADKAFSVGERSRLVALGGRVERVAIGVQARDGSSAVLAGTRIMETGIGADARVKHWRYDAGGQATLLGVDLDRVPIPYRAGPRSATTVLAGMGAAPCALAQRPEAADPLTSAWLRAALERACGADTAAHRSGPARP